MTMELFVELGCEELPARFVGPAVASLAEGLGKLLAGVERGPARTWGSSALEPTKKLM